MHAHSLGVLIFFFVFRTVVSVLERAWLFCTCLRVCCLYVCLFMFVRIYVHVFFSYMCADLCTFTQYIRTGSVSLFVFNVCL